MKISTRLNSKRFKQIAAIFSLTVACVSLNSCAKDASTSTPAISGLMVVNASPTPATYNLYLNTTKVNTAALPFAGSLPYFQITPGANTLKFTTASSTESLLTKVVNLDANKPYSLFLIDKAEKLDGLLVSDDLSSSNSAKPLIRFINLSPDAGTLTLSQTAAAAIAPDEAFKGYSTFSEVDAKTYALQIKDKETGTVLSSLENVVLAAGKTYTIVAAGMVAATATDQALRILVITNR
jgi:hypothetical protein